MTARPTKENCCERFAQCVAEHSIIYCGVEDETEWAVPTFYHLYYCPFCGAFIKGRGWGEEDKRQSQQSRRRGGR